MNGFNRGAMGSRQAQLLALSAGLAGWLMTGCGGDSAEGGGMQAAAGGAAPSGSANVGAPPEARPSMSASSASTAATSPGASQSGAGPAPQPGSPTMGGQAMGDPAMGDPAMGDPAMGDPAMGDPAMGDPAMEATRPAATSVSLDTTMENPNAAPWFNVYRPSDLEAAQEATGGLLPVIVWANGGCFRSDFTWEPLFSRWAAAGYVVLALTESTQAGALTQTTVSDHGGLIDWALEQADYADMLDPERVVSAGNSCGGITALGLAAADDRPAAVFVLSGSSNIGRANLQVVNAVKVPVGYIVGGREDIAGANATSDYEAFSEGLPAAIVSRSSGDHVLVSTDPAILKEEAEIALNWMDLALYGTQEAYDALTSDNVCENCTPGDWSLESKHLETLTEP
ncbi:MAG: hypothetical protein OXR73_14385 [Myxococcales bacterium]|nr:hypothetical protein [Myxococcales bacterium]